MKYQIVTGDLLNQKCDVIVNPWNRNIIPWWLLLPHGVSGAIKRKAGIKPFIELGHHGPIPLGTAVVTSAGRLPFVAIIHVAGIDGFWRASKRSIHDSVVNAVKQAENLGISSIAFPVIGSGAGGLSGLVAEEVMFKTLEELTSQLKVTVVRYHEN